MFCKSCGSQLKLPSNYCTHCGKELDKDKVPELNDAAGPSVPSADVKTKLKTANRSIKSFIDFKVSKGKQWKSTVTSKQETTQEKEIMIYIGLYEWSPKANSLKPKRGKRLALRVLPSVSYPILRSKAAEKWKAFHSNIYDEEQSYDLLYEDGQRAVFMPGTKEPFTLKRYQEETGRDYNRITLFLCSNNDYCVSAGLNDSDSEASDLELPSPKRAKKEIANHSTDFVVIDEGSPQKEQINSDEQLATEIQLQWNKETGVDDSYVDSYVENVDKFENSISVVKALEKMVDSTQQMFIVVRRGAPLLRVLSLWSRESSKTSPENLLRVHYHGEAGIDTGAMAKEFLSQTVMNIGISMFPGGSPLNSTNNVQNGNLKACGQIVAVSLAQGGPSPSFLEECIYNQLVSPEIEIQDLDPGKHLTRNEQDFLKSIKEDVHHHSDTIIEHGYTGRIDEEHLNDIVRSITVSLVTRRAVYLREFLAGLRLYGLDKIICQNPSTCQPLFVKSENVQVVDANYLYSVIHPEYSPKGTSRRNIEENVMDLFQDFLISLEDESEITGYTSAIAWNYDDATENSALPPNEEFEIADMTAAGIMGWLTGQKHKPLDGEDFKIYAKFDHDCLTENANHKICFPRVSACAKQITFPTAHMGTAEAFSHVFVLAFCKGQAFGRV